MIHQHCPRAYHLCLLLPLFAFHQSLAELDIRVPPSIIHQSRGEVLFAENDTITLKCEGNGYPHPTFTWLYNKTRLDLTRDHIKMDYPGQKGTLIMSPTADDQGEYVCQATNPWGTAITDIISLKMAFDGKRLPPPAQTPIQNAIEGQPVALKCKGFTAFYPPAQITWQKKQGNESVGLHISENMKYGYDEYLYFASVTPEDDGMYACFGYNTFTQVVKGGHNIHLIVTQKSDLTLHPPTLAYATQGTVLVNREDSETLKCAFYGYPTPKITWQKDGQAIEIEEEDDYYYYNYYDYDYDLNKYRISDEGSALTIELFGESDEGRYSCVGENRAGRQVQDIEVRVALGYVSETVQPINTNMSVGEEIIVPCKASGYPDVEQIVWMVNGEPINDKSQRQGHLSKIKVQRDTLVIPDLCKNCPDGTSDLMVIQCVSLNSRSRAFAQGYVNVLEQTSISKPPEDVVLEGPGLATFSCEGKTDPSTPVTYTWLFNEHILEHSGIIDPNIGLLIMNNNMHLMLNITESINSRNVSHFGNITCNISNNYTSVTASAIFSSSPIRGILDQDNTSNQDIQKRHQTTRLIIRGSVRAGSNETVSRDNKRVSTIANHSRPVIKQTLDKNHIPEGLDTTYWTLEGKVAIIAGGIVGLLFLLLVLIPFYKRKRKKKRSSSDQESDFA